MSERVKRHLGNLPALDGIPPAVSNAIGAGPVSFYVTEYRHICWQGSGPKGQPKFKLLTAVFTNSLHSKGGETQSSASSGGLGRLDAESVFRLFQRTLDSHGGGINV